MGSLRNTERYAVGPRFLRRWDLSTACLYVRMGHVSIAFTCAHREASNLHEKPRRKTSVWNPKQAVYR